jgi:hypothetical protein
MTKPAVETKIAERKKFIVQIAAARKQADLAKKAAKVAKGGLKLAKQKFKDARRKAKKLRKGLKTLEAGLAALAVKRPRPKPKTAPRKLATKRAQMAEPVVAPAVEAAPVLIEMPPVAPAS